MEEKETAVSVKNLSFFYGDNEVLKNISINIYKNSITALMGPSGCGKTTFLRCFNRIHDLYPNIEIRNKKQYVVRSAECLIPIP